MDSSILKQFLIEYEKKKSNEEYNAEIRKKNLYEKEPSLKELDKKLSLLAISTAKELLNNNDSKIIDNMNKQIEELKQQKLSILKNLNIPDDYFSPNYECKICNDTGFVTKDYNTTMCSCLKQKIFDAQYNQTNITNLKMQTFDTFSDLLYSDTIDEKKYNAPKSPRENINTIKDACLTFIDNFDNPNEKNLLFTGNTGLGKTFLSSCIANELIKKNKNVLYQTAPIMLDTILDYRFGKNTQNKNIYDSLLNVDLLIIDDLGTESMNNIKFTELFNIINTRLLNQNKVMKTIISTNLSLENLYDTYDERITSRIFGNYKLCYFFGEDIRLKKR